MDLTDISRIFIQQLHNIQSQKPMECSQKYMIYYNINQVNKRKLKSTFAVYQTRMEQN
jgi:hypothetical protein